MKREESKVMKKKEWSNSIHAPLPVNKRCDTGSECCYDNMSKGYKLQDSKTLSIDSPGTWCHNPWILLTSCPSRTTLRANHRLTLDLWLAKDNRFLNPKSSYKRILMAPPCRLIQNEFLDHQPTVRWQTMTSPSTFFHWLVFIVVSMTSQKNERK
jgi:hypothetical protein